MNLTSKHSSHQFPPSSHLDHKTIQNKQKTTENGKDITNSLFLDDSDCDIIRLKYCLPFIPNDFMDWSDEKQKAWKLIPSFPSIYYYFYLAPGIAPSHYPPDEKEFLECLRIYPPQLNGWGLFSLHVPGLNGKQCHQFYKELVRNKKVNEKYQSLPSFHKSDIQKYYSGFLTACKLYPLSLKEDHFHTHKGTSYNRQKDIKPKKKQSRKHKNKKEIHNSDFSEDSFRFNDSQEIGETSESDEEAITLIKKEKGMDDMIFTPKADNSPKSYDTPCTIRSQVSPPSSISTGTEVESSPAYDTCRTPPLKERENQYVTPEPNFEKSSLPPTLKRSNIRQTKYFQTSGILDSPIIDDLSAIINSVKSGKEEQQSETFLEIVTPKRALFSDCASPIQTESIETVKTDNCVDETITIDKSVSCKDLSTEETRSPIVEISCQEIKRINIEDSSPQLIAPPCTTITETIVKKSVVPRITDLQKRKIDCITNGYTPKRTKSVLDLLNKPIIEIPSLIPPRDEDGLFELKLIQYHCYIDYQRLTNVMSNSFRFLQKQYGVIMSQKNQERMEMFTIYLSDELARLEKKYDQCIYDIKERFESEFQVMESMIECGQSYQILFDNPYPNPFH